MIQFSLPCPIDGPVELSILDIASIVIHDEDAVDVVFRCPLCHGEIKVSAQVPHMLLASLNEAVAADEVTGERRMKLTPIVDEADDLPALPALPALPRHEPDPLEQERISRYVEYFRRQLDAMPSVEAMLEELDEDR